MKKTINKLVIFFMLFFSACSVNKNYSRFLKAQEVEIRVSERWEALVENKHTKVYEYHTKSFRDVTDLEGYIKSVSQKKIKWTRFELMRTRCEDDICRVNIQVGYHVPPMFGLPKGMDASENIKETWIHRGGEWFYLPPK